MDDCRRCMPSPGAADARLSPRSAAECRPGPSVVRRIVDDPLWRAVPRCDAVRLLGPASLLCLRRGLN